MIVQKTNKYFATLRNVSHQSPLFIQQDITQSLITNYSHLDNVANNIIGVSNPKKFAGNINFESIASFRRLGILQQCRMCSNI